MRRGSWWIYNGINRRKLAWRQTAYHSVSNKKVKNCAIDEDFIIFTASARVQLLPTGFNLFSFVFPKWRLLIWTQSPGPTLHNQAAVCGSRTCTLGELTCDLTALDTCFLINQAALTSTAYDVQRSRHEPVTVMGFHTLQPIKDQMSSL